MSTDEERSNDDGTVVEGLRRRLADAERRSELRRRMMVMQHERACVAEGKLAKVRESVTGLRDRYERLDYDTPVMLGDVVADIDFALADGAAGVADPWETPKPSAERTARMQAAAEKVEPQQWSGTDGLPTDADLAQYPICSTCGARITRSSSEWFHVDASDWDRMLCWRGGPRAAPSVPHRGCTVCRPSLAEEPTQP